MRFERYKVVKQTTKYSFNDLSKMVDMNNSKKITEIEYQFLSGRLYQGKSDFLVSPSGKLYTIGGSNNNRFIVPVLGKPLMVYGGGLKNE